MKNKRLVGLVGSICLVLVLVVLPFMAPCSAATPASGVLPKVLKLGTSAPGGSFYIIASAIGKLLQDKLGITVIVTPSAGSMDNLNLMNKDEIDMAIIAANTAGPAYAGEAWRVPRPYKKMRTVMGLFSDVAVFHALASSGMTKFTDLKGKRVGCGSGASTWAPLFTPVFKAAGMTPGKDVTLVYSGFQDMYNELGDGTLAACVDTAQGGRVPFPQVAQLASRKPLVNLTFSAKTIDATVAHFTCYSKATLDIKGIPGLEKPMPSFDIGGPQVYVRADMSDAAVYTITKTLYENLGSLAKAASYFGLVTKHSAVQNVGVPFHPGAIKFWKEIGNWSGS